MLPSTRATVEWASTADRNQLVGERLALAESAYDVVPGTASETRRPDNYGQCVWDNKDSDGETSRTECFANVVETGKALAYPFPRSSYHYDTDPNHAVKEDSLDKPHIALDIEFDVSKNNAVSVVDTQYFDFENFETNAASILYKSTGHSAGRYNPETLKGSTRKTARRSCQNANKDGFTKANVDELKFQVDKLVEYRQKADNNKCSDDRSDTMGLHQLFRCRVRARQQGRHQSRRRPPKLEVLPLSVHMRPIVKFYTPYSCAADYGVEGLDRRQCAGDATQFCNFTQTVTARASDLVSKVQVGLKPSPVKPPILDPKTEFPGSNYNAPSTTSKELHFDVTCDNNAPEFATYCTSHLQVKVSDLFKLEATLNTDNDAVKALLANRPTTTTNPIVFWRVKNTLAGTWQEISAATGDLKDSTAVLTFPQFKSELVFEAYTACGKVGDSITWTIYVHRASH
ncbi:hypothetical protein H257_13706 [Aphanomyces astaci]|uniref:Uncharacterized protein n=1 Tax=Aphanomyces astaci TaxID=112090 RepID=W4FWD2_APHAT|nr:hypothetical protein H257_13706 [Aphanomyces astaci]ETV70973.1 hypothetical protein H257_13706 [Aphanomyces astaci]|eukprot:XP_009839636.1 hypothetical protein H257_13706 [Aphanomyces astaci]